MVIAPGNADNPGVPPADRRPRLKFPQALAALQDYCASLRPGDLIPTHTELMRRFDASERAVLRALEELQREGRIVRRRGIGTFIAEPSAAPAKPEPVVPESLFDSRTIIAIIKPDHSFFDRCLELLFLHAKLVDLTVACRLVDDSRDAAMEHMVETGDAAGFMVFQWDLAPIAQKLRDAGQRVVLLGTPPLQSNVEFPTVGSDHEQGGFLALNHLLELGHRRILFAGFTGFDSGARGHGHARAVRGWNMRAEHRAVPEGIQPEALQLTAYSGEEIARWERDLTIPRTYFAGEFAPTAIVAWNDHQALSLLRILGRLGIEVPGRISLIGYDAMPEGTLVHPSLTTVDPQIDQQLQSALGLLQRPSPPPSAHSVVVVPALIVRESTGPVQP